MRTRLLFVLASLVGCDQLTTPDEPPLQAMAAATAVTTPVPAPWRERWATPHDGVSIRWAGNVVLYPDTGPSIDAIRIRIELAPRDRVMSFDASDARLEVTGHAAIHPIAINASLATLPLVTLDRGTTASIDLWFPIADAPGSFVFAWSTVTPKGRTGLRALLHLDGSAADQPGVTDRWWFAPTYEWSTYRHHDGVITPQPPTSARLGAISKTDVANPCDQW